MKKYIILIFCLVCIKLFNITFITNEINLYGGISTFASNLYLDDEAVSEENIEVIDYEIKDDSLYVTPVNKEVVLPISGIINNITDEYIEIQSASNSYKIYNVDSKYRMYQYYKKNTILGYSDEYYIVSLNYQSIVSHFIFNYEEV